jgi:RIO kinase 1
MTDDLEVLLADGIIDEVLGRLKSGKEANISLVRRGQDVLAAKVYKDRATRSFKNNADYKEGRKVRNSRTQRAIDSGGRFGRDAAEQAWKSAEADALYKLVGSGVRAPMPVLFYEGVLLMELVKDAEGRPAPRMIDVSIDQAGAMGVYADLVAQIIAMLCVDLIHGDLSPYNILAAAEGPTIIDFPQVVSAVHSTRAEYFFLRDFDNVVRFVSGFDPTLAVHKHDGRAIWRAYVSRELTRDFVPPPAPPPQARGPAQSRRREPQADGRAPARLDRLPSQPGPTPRGADRQRHEPAPTPPPGRATGARPDPRRGESRRWDSQGPSGPRPQGPSAPRPQSPSGPRPQGPSAPRPQSPSGPRPQRAPGSAQQVNGRVQSDPRPTSQPPRFSPASRPTQGSESRHAVDVAQPPPGGAKPAPLEWSMPATSARTPPPSRGPRRRPKRRW